MQNNLMGAPAPATPQTPGLNFQSDPGMRSQFKGFMSGLQARQSPAPAMQPPMAMPTVPQQMATMDIFQPVQTFARGGDVGRMDYQGAPISGVTGTVAGSATSDFGSAASFPQATGRTISGVDYVSQNFRDDPVNQIINLTARPAITQLYDQGIAGLQNLFGSGDDADRVAAADANMNAANAEADALAQQIDRMRRNEVAANEAASNAQALANQQTIQSVIADAVAGADANLLNTDIIGFEDDARAAQRAAAEYITSRGGNVTVDPTTGQVSGDIDQIFDIDTTFAPYEIDGISSPRNLPSAPPSRPSRPSARDLSLASPYDMVSAPTPTGYDEVGTQVPVQQAPAPESILDRAARKDDMSGARQLVQRGFGAGTDPMAQLQARSERDIFDTGEMVPGIGAALAGLANRMGQGMSKGLQDRLERGGIPQYDNTGQIVGAYMPGGGLFGSTVYYGNTEFRDPAREREIAQGVASRNRQEQASFGGDDDPVNPFLRLLGFEDGGEVPTPFRAGGGVGRQDYEGASIAGVSGNVAGSTTSDVGSSQSQGQQASGRSFSGADLYGNQNMTQDNVQTVMATPVSQPQDTVSGGQVAPQSQDVVPATVSEGEFLEPIQAPAQQPMSVRERIAAVAEQSQPTFSSLLGDLFDFSAEPDAMSDLERKQLEVRGRMAGRGEDYYGQNLTPSLQQAYSQAGIAAAPTAAATLQRGVSGGQRVSVPVAAQYLSPQQIAAGVQGGVQMLGEKIQFNR